jgi:excisionase family DNA binding protein
MEATEDLMTATDVATHLHVRVETVRKWIADGDLPALALPGGGYRIRRSDLGKVLQPVEAGK